MRFLATLGMTRVGMCVALGMTLVLAACDGIDPCSIDRSSPSCSISQSKANATIGAIDADAALRATQSAIYLRAEQTKAAINADATRQVVKAEATQSAMIVEATRQAIDAEQRQSAVIYKSTQTFADGEATKVAIAVGGALERANVERAAVPYNSVFNVMVFWFVLPALIVAGLIVYGRRTVKRATEAMTQAMHKRAAMIAYGNPGNPQLAFVTFDQVTGQPVRFITSEGMIGNTVNLLNGRTMLDEMAIPEPLRLAAMVEVSKRSQAVRIAAATNSAPWGSVTVMENPAPLAAPQPITPATLMAPHVPTFAEMLQTWSPTIEQMIYGFGEDGKPVYCSLDQMLSALVVGRQGQGKTTLLRLISLQCMLTGVEVVAWDIHDDIAEDVPDIRICSRGSEIEESALAINAELDRRIRLKLKHERAKPTMVLIDEVNLLVERVPMLVEVIKRIVSEGRKYRMFEFVTAKGAPSDIFEKSWARDTFGALISFWTSALQARNAGFEPDTARAVETLTPGHALLRLQTAAAQVVTFPDLPLGDFKRLMSGSRAASGAASNVASGPLPDYASAASAEASREAGKAAEVDYFDGVEAAGKREQIRQMLKSGRSQREIIAELWGATGGRSYQEAARELNTIIGELVQ